MKLKSSVKYLLLLLVSFCYLQAAFEVNTDSFKNTWGDEYDTYIHAEKQDVSSSQKVIKYLDFSFELPPSFLLADDFIAKDFTDLFSPSPPFTPPKIYLRNSVFRI